jgi:U2-associated protein SR140
LASFNQTAYQICQLLEAELTRSDVGVNRKIALLFLVSDILHNSGYAEIRNAWRFRQEFLNILKNVFHNLGATWASITGRLTAEIIKEKVISVIRAWNRWSIFPQDFTRDLESVFLSKPIDPPNSVAQQVVTQTHPKADLPVQHSVPIPMERVDSVMERNEEDTWDIDGEPLF